MKYDFVNKYAYFSEEIGNQFPESILDELYIHVFVDARHGHDKVTGISITGLLSVVGSTPTLWLSKLQTVVQTSTFGAKFKSLKNNIEEYVMIRYHLI